MTDLLTGWEELGGPPSTYPGPQDVVRAPRLLPSPLSLVSTCEAEQALADVAPANAMPPDDMLDSPLPGPKYDRWALGFQFLPEEIGPANGYAWCGDFPDAIDNDANNCSGKAIVLTFETVEKDERSTLGVLASDALDRVQRGLLAHEAWRVENEFWTGTLNPGNPHLTQAGPFYPVDQVSGGDSSTAIGLAQALGLLEQSIASHDAGKGIIHCTPFMFNAWATRGGIPFRYDGSTPASSTRIWTPNGNLVVPGYGYDGSAPSGKDGITNAQFQKQQWAYATDMIYLLRGPIVLEPAEYRDMSPDIPIYNAVPWRATRPWAIYSNGALRAAVLVDSTTS